MLNLTEEERKPIILIVDDQSFMRHIIRAGLINEGYDFIEAEDGEKAVQLFNEYQPDIILLDAVMPKMDGFEVCKRVRGSEKGDRTPILMITALGDTNSINSGFSAGVNDFIQKPLNIEILKRRLALMINEKNNDEKLRRSEAKFRLLAENAKDCIIIIQIPFKYEYISPVIESITGYSANDFYTDPDLIRKVIYHKDLAVIENIIKSRAFRPQPYEFRIVHKQGHRVYVESNIVPVITKKKITGLQIIARDATQRKIDEARKQVELTQKVLFETVKALSATIETRDPYTSGHQYRVAELSVEISKELGLDTNQIEGVQTAALLHDIGKITIPAEYLSKPGELTEMEFNVIKLHTSVGYNILKPIEFPWPVARIVYQHHERMDGLGYPCELTAKDILAETRIISVADVVEAMFSHRPYRAALGLDKALDEILINMEKKYDPLVVKACINVFRKNRFTISDKSCHKTEATAKD